MSNLEQFRFLVVDDSPVNQAILMHRLTRLGAAVLLASNGLEALERCKEHSFDLIFLDIQMPELDGFSTVEKLKELYPATIVIAWTCSVDESQVSFFEAGFDGYLDKPIHKQSFVQILSQHLGIKNEHPGKENLNADFLASELSVHSREVITVHSGFLSKLPERVLELSHLFESDQRQELAFQSRKLRGTAKLSGLTHLSEILRTIEMQAHSGPPEQLGDTLQTLATAIARYMEDRLHSSDEEGSVS